MRARTLARDSGNIEAVCKTEGRIHGGPCFAASNRPLRPSPATALPFSAGPACTRAGPGRRPDSRAGVDNPAAAAACHWCHWQSTTRTRQSRLTECWPAAVAVAVAVEVAGVWGSWYLRPQPQGRGVSLLDAMIRVRQLPKLISLLRAEFRAGPLAGRHPGVGSAPADCSGPSSEPGRRPAFTPARDLGRR